MFITTGMATIMILAKLLVGFLAGLVVAWVVLRSRMTLKAAVLAAIASAFLFILASGFVGWASSHEAWLNGKRLDVAPWGEDLRWRNRIAENEALICFVPSALAACAVAYMFRKKAI